MMQFDASFFAGNRARLRALVPSDDPIVITANGQLQRGNDDTFPFQQDANFWYLTGIDEADFVLVMHGNEEYLIVPPRSRVQNIFDGTYNPSEFTRVSGITAILSAREGWKRLAVELSQTKTVQTLAANPSYIRLIGMYTNPARRRLLQRIKRTNPKLQFEYIGKQLATLRVIKQAPELSAIRRAVDSTCDAVAYVQAHTYSYEYELEAALTQAFRNSGATGHGYDPIVASGENSCVLHYGRNQSAIGDEAIVLIDVGASYTHYTADISRTWTQTTPTARQRDVIQAVSDTISYGKSLLRPGVSFRDCEQKIRSDIGQKLKALGLVTDATDKVAIARYYPHAPHYLGLNVHDVGDYQQPLAPGMVLTLEPGIYIPEEAIGVRIEDDILITDNGIEVLSQQLSQTYNLS